MQLLGVYNSEAEAYIDKGYLATHGIDTVVEEDAISTVFPGPAGGPAGVQLYVDDAQYGRAKELLDNRPA